ncbi:hypothetical protein ABH942_000029 [Flavobacterium sp. 28YEA47A]|uniref:hypothetical protein n=1 Tax=Flavobacterium sp. 28YEA47A TaxID=3156276 RepID=UPI0035148123
MNYYEELKPAKSPNLQPLEELLDKVHLSKELDTKYYSTKVENNIERLVFRMGTGNINIVPTVRLVSCVKKGKRKDSYQSFVIETKEKSTGIAVVLMKSEDNEVFHCNIRILPLNNLNDIAEVEADSKLLTVNLEKSKIVLKTDITISQSETGQALYSVHDVDVSKISDLVTEAEVVGLSNELKYIGARLVAHYFQNVMNFFNHDGKHTSVLPSDKLKELLLANVMAGCIVIELVGSSVIQDLNKDWKAAQSFTAYLLDY